MSPTLQRSRQGPVSYLRGGEGAPFVLLHGIPDSAASWQAAGTALAEHFDVIIPDMLGFGASDAPRGDYYIEAQAQAIADLLGALGIGAFHLGAHDIGGPVAITLMRLHPQRVVEGLLVAPTNLLKSVKIPRFFKLARIPVVTGLVNRLMIGNPIAHRLLYAKAVCHKEAFSWAMYRQHLSRTGRRFTRLMFQRTMIDFETIYAPIEDHLSTLDLPTLILWGARDPVLRRSLGRRTHELIRGSQLAIYEDTGHFLPEERPHRLAEDTIRFFVDGQPPRSD